jgi:hypothetical protein
MLGNDYPNPYAFLALNIETGEIMSVYPDYSPKDWERVL